MSSYSYGIANDNDSSNTPIFDGTNWEDFANDYRLLVTGKGAELPEKPDGPFCETHSISYCWENSPQYKQILVKAGEHLFSLN